MRSISTSGIWSVPGVVLLISCSLIGCTATPGEMDESVGLEVDRSAWSEDRQVLDEKVEQFLDRPNKMNEAINEGGPRQLGIQADEKAEALKGLEQKIEDHIEIQGDAAPDDSELPAWGQFRIGQLYLNFACQISGVEPPLNIPKDTVQEYQIALADLSIPLLEQTESLLQRVRTYDESPWSQAANSLKESLAPALELERSTENPTNEPSPGDRYNTLRDACDDTADYW